MDGNSTLSAEPVGANQRHLIQVIFDRFHATAEWPLVDTLRHELDLNDDDLDVVGVGRTLDPALGTVGIGHQARASLTIHGLALCSGADQELDDVLRTVQYAYGRFRATGPGARVTSEELAANLEMDPLRIRRTYELIHWLPGIGGGGGTGADSWYREITPDITEFKPAKTVEAMLEIAPRPGTAGRTVLPIPVSGTKRSMATLPAPAPKADSSVRKPAIEAADGRGGSPPVRVFLCHSSADKVPVRELYGRLVSDRIEPWFDEVDLLPGQDWQLEIEKAVRSSAIVLVCLSEGSVNKAGFVQKEIRLALDVADEQPEGTTFIIPVRLAGCSVPARLSRWQWVDLYSSGGYEQLLAAIRMSPAGKRARRTRKRPTSEGVGGSTGGGDRGALSPNERRTSKEGYKVAARSPSVLSNVARIRNKLA